MQVFSFTVWVKVGMGASPIAFSGFSKDTPFVSGRYLKIRIKPTMHITAKIQNVKAALNTSTKTGNVRVSRKQATHSEKVVIDMAAPRILLGKISDKITQTLGPGLRAKKAGVITMKVRRSQSPVRPVKNKKPITT